MIIFLIPFVFGITGNSSNYTLSSKMDFGVSGNGSSTTYSQRYISGEQPVAQYNSSLYTGRFGILEDSVPDTINPNVTINSPSATTYTTNPISFSVTLDEKGSCSYSLDSGATNSSMASSDSLTFTDSSTLADGNYISNFYCSDISGNKNNTESVNFTVAVPTPAAPGGGGGSSSSGTTIPSVNFRLGNTSYEITLPVSGVSYKTLEIISEEESEKTFSISTNLPNIIILDQHSLTLQGKEKGKAVFKIVAPKETGVYAGKVVVKSGSTTKTLLISINVKTKKSLYDLTVLISENLKTMKLGDTLTAQIGLLQAGRKESMDVTLKYLIKDFDGETYLSESETIQVYDQKSFDREFYTGEFLSGDYVLGVELIYPDGVAVASSQFKIKEEFKLNKEQYILIGLVVIIVISLAIVIIKYKRTKIHHKNR